MAFTTGAFYAAGGTAALLTTVRSWDAMTVPTAVLVGLALLAVTCGLLLLARGERLPRWAFHVVVGQASLLLAAAVALSADEAAALAVASVFVFCAVDILYFFAPRGALAQAVVLLAAVAASLTWRGVDPGTVGALVLVQVATITVIGRLVQRADDRSRDHLTGLANRRAFDERLDEALATAHRAGPAAAPLCVALLDVDRFKAVNDAGGHGAGDALLVSLARALAAPLPPTAVLARHGGDEFALLAPGLDLPAATSLAERMRAAAAPTGLSVGVAQLVAGEGAAELVRRADAALYRAKGAGRGCVRADGAALAAAS